MVRFLDKSNVEEILNQKNYITNLFNSDKKLQKLVSKAGKKIITPLCINKETNELGLFGAYHINTIKEKVEASGYPDNCNTDTAKEQYIKDFYINQGIELDRNKNRI